MQNSLEKSLSNLKLYAQAFSPLIINLPAIISLPIILLSEFPFLIVSGLCFAIDVIVLQQFFSLKEENEQKIEQISNNAKFIKITLLPFIPETLKNVFPLSSVTDFCENNPDKALMIYNHLFNNKTQLLINKIMEISSLENLWQNPLILGQLLLSIPLFLLSCTSDFFNIFLFFPSLFVFVLGLYFSSAINRLWSQILTAPWVIYQTIYAQKQASPQAQEESNAVISSQNTQEAETSQNIVFDYDIQYVAELSTTNLKRDSIYFCEYTRAYVYLNQKNQINSGLIPDEIDIKNHQKFHKHLLSIIGTEIPLSIYGSINNNSFCASINRKDNQTFVSSSLQTPSSRIGVDFLLKKNERQTVVGLKVSNHTVSKNTFFHIGFGHQNNLQRPEIEDANNFEAIGFTRENSLTL